MGRVERSIEIKAPPEKVWDMLAFDRLPEWTETFGSMIINLDFGFILRLSNIAVFTGSSLKEYPITISLFQSMFLKAL